MTGDLVLAEHDPAPPWALPAVTAAAEWLHTAYTAANTKTSYATALGIPRAMQALWRGDPSEHHNVRLVPDPCAFFPWCARHGIDPYAEVDRKVLRRWITEQDASGIARTTIKARLGAVSAWYREQRHQRRTTIEVPAALPREERRNLHVSTPAPKRPRVAWSLPQVKALRFAAAHYPGALRLRYQMIVDFLATTGIRAEELCALDRGDIYRTGPDGDPAVLIDGKGDKERWGRISPTLLALIDAYLAERDQAESSRGVAVRGQVSAKPADQPLLTTKTGARLETQEIVKALKYLCRFLQRAADRLPRPARAHATQLAGIVDTIRPHQARRFYARVAEDHGVPVRQISIDLGHSSISVTQAYLDDGKNLASSAGLLIADLLTAGERSTEPGPHLSSAKRI
ncbi:tyrosine-type recombinase/integrase [Amycolatopsis minnesotensis]|uniref:Tyr recombinase domain-containing protein n=1 Tax=Amycolatopsis minnesotensis TaxID=337894 RepID=A0ABN2SAP3_9PSEU